MTEIIVQTVLWYAVAGFFSAAFFIGSIYLDEKPSAPLFLSFLLFWPLYWVTLISKLIFKLIFNVRKSVSIFKMTAKLLKRL